MYGPLPYWGPLPILLSYCAHCIWKPSIFDLDQSSVQMRTALFSKVLFRTCYPARVRSRGKVIMLGTYYM